MEFSGQEPDMPIPLNSSYGGNHGHAHVIHLDPTSQNHNIIPSSAPINGPIVPEDNHVLNFKKMVKYKECLKNHAAAMGGNATDGCGEFMPSGEEGSLEALTCSACNCHRNFHRKEVEGDHQPAPLFLSHENYCYPNVNPRIGRKIFVGHNGLGYHNHNNAAGGGLISSRPHQMMMPYNNMGSLPSDSEEEGGGGGVRPPMMKKRFRTKFSQEQKEKMMSFAEKVGWKIQKQEEGVIQQFCQEIGVKRRVLKVWMHNNKHSLAKKNGNQLLQQPNDGHEHQV